MARDWNTQLTAWARPPSATETEKMGRAEKAIRDAVAASAKLRAHGATTHPQGSYYNRTNVPRESDVDIRVVAGDVFFTDWGLVDKNAPLDGAIRERLDREVGNFDSTYSYAEFKDDVEAALVARFGRAAVVRGDRAFDIHENTYRVESDCLAAFPSLLYALDAYGRISVRATGIEFRTDEGRRIQNFPEQQHEEGVAKHERTRQRFKKMVRITKNLRNEMEDAGIKAAGPIPSFLVECLVWNVPDRLFGQVTYYDDMRAVLASIYTDTAEPDRCRDWTEENGIKFLFHPSQPWTREQANAFALAAWTYVGFS